MRKFILSLLFLLVTALCCAAPDRDSVTRSMVVRISNLFNCAEIDDEELFRLVDSLGAYALPRKLYYDYFEAESYACQFLIYHSRINEAMQRLRISAELAKKLHHRLGLVNSYENYGVLYQMIWRYDEAREAFESGLEILREEDDRHGFQMQLITYLIEIACEQQRPDEAERYLDAYADLIVRNEALPEQSDEKLLAETLRRCRKLHHVYSLRLCLMRRDFAKATEHLDRLEAYRDVTDHYVNALELSYTSEYFAETGQFGKALQTLGRANTQGLLDMQMQRTAASVYYKTGEYKRSADTYRTTVAMLDSLYDKEFMTKISEMYSLHEVDALQLRIHEERLKSAQLRARNIRILILLLVVILLVISALFARTYRLKARLQESTRRLEEERNELIAARNKAQESERLKDRFLQNISHEIRTPLNAIAGFSEIIASECGERKDMEEYREMIRKNTQLLLSLVNNILQQSRLESEIPEPRLREFRAADLLNFVRNNTIGLCKPGVAMEVAVVPENLTLRGDLHLLEQVLINLANNACKFTESGRIELRAEAAENEVRLSVTDTGCGIPASKRQEIFERFRKLDDFKPGSGLGLAISRLIVRKMRGSIHVDESYDAGARFVVTLPTEAEQAA